MRIPVYERQVGIAPIPGARVGGVGGPEAYGAGIGRAVEALGERVRRMAEDVEDAQTLEAFNAFKREAFEYHEDPDKGLLNTRLGNGAVGVYRDADAWMGNKAGEYEARMPSARSAQNFRRMAEQYRMQQGERNSRFEADQIKAYRDGEADATIRLGLDEIAEKFDDDKAVEAARQQMMLALELKTRGRGTEARRAAYEAMEGQISMTRLARMIQKDPVMAEAWFRENERSFSGEDLVRAEGAVKRAMEKVRNEAEKEAVYAATDELMDRFGTDERAAWNAMENDPSLDPETRERIWGKYKARLSDRERWEAQRDRDYMSGWMDKIADSSSMEEAQQFIQDSGADGRQRVQLESWAAQIHRPEKFKEDIRDWAQAFKEVINGQLKTDEELIYRWGGRLSSDTLKSLIRIFYKERESGAGKKGADYVGYQHSDAVQTAMRNLRIKEGSQESAVFTTIVGEEIYYRATQLKRSLSPLEKFKVLEEVAKRYVTNDGDILSEFQRRMAERRGFIDTDGQGFVRKNADGSYERYDPSQSYELPPLGEGEDPPRQPEPLQPLPDRRGQKEKAPAEPGQKRQKRPKMMPDGTPYEQESRPQPAGKSGGPLGARMLPDVKARRTGKFDDWRGYRNGKHNGEDWAAPEGASIVVPSGLAEEFRVVKSGKSNGAGNTVTLEGKMPDGKTVSLQVSHMQDGSIALGNGDVVRPGALVGRVGNTGMTSDRAKGGITAWYPGKKSGHHLDIKVKIDGKYVDPATLG